MSSKEDKVLVVILAFFILFITCTGISIYVYDAHEDTRNGIIYSLQMLVGNIHEHEYANGYKNVTTQRCIQEQYISRDWRRFDKEIANYRDSTKITSVRVQGKPANTCFELDVEIHDRTLCKKLLQTDWPFFSSIRIGSEKIVGWNVPVSDENADELCRVRDMTLTLEFR